MRECKQCGTSWDAPVGLCPKCGEPGQLRPTSRSGRKKDDMGQRRRDVTSAMYFLVWHGGMGYSSADWLLSAYPKLVILFAKRGRFEARRCFPLFAQLLEKVANAA